MIKGRKRPRVFYGWWIVIASAITYAMFGGFYTYGFSALFMPLISEFGWSRASLSGVFSLSRVGGGLIGPAGGFLVDRFGPRRIMALGLALMGGGFILLSRMDSLIAFYIVFILLIAVGGTVAAQRATVVAITNWFIKKRGTAVGLGISGMGLGGVLVPLIALLIAQYGWRQTTIIIGLLIWAIGIPAALVMRHRPEQYGYLPDGETQEERIGQKCPETVEVVVSEDINFTPRQALRTRAFWLLALIFGLRQLVIGALLVHQIPFLTGLGISAEVAAALLGSIGVVSIAGRLIFGRMADILDKRYVMVISTALVAIGALILGNAQTLWHIIVFLIVYAPGYGGAAAVMLAIRGEYFGRQYFGTIGGWMDLVQMFGIVGGPIFAGWVFDVTESYRLAFLTFAGSAAIATILMLVVRRPPPPRSGNLVELQT